MKKQSDKMKLLIQSIKLIKESPKKEEKSVEEKSVEEKPVKKEWKKKKKEENQ